MTRANAVSRFIPGLALAFGIAPGLAWAATGGGEGADAPVLAPVTVIGTSPLPGTRLDIAKAPYDVQTLTGEALRETGAATAGGALEARLGSVSLNDNLDSPFQPDILYRGFEASPVLGTPQGLAVYQNGVRINEAFGDAVNWDLVPDTAVSRIDLVGGNPVYGLNALGGAVVVTMKTGFDAPGQETELQGGSFGRRSASLTLSGHGETVGALLAVKVLDDDGWRDRSRSRLRQLYGDLGWRGDRVRLDLSYAGADNDLHGESAAPVQELAVSRKAIFTSPQRNADRLGFVTLNGSYTASPTLSVQGALHVRAFRQAVDNGNTTSFMACSPPAETGTLCQGDGTTPLSDSQGRPVPDLSQGGVRPIGENDRESLSATTYGASLQVASSAPLLGHPNQATAGLALDTSRVDFLSTVEVGVVDAGLVVQPSGYLVETPEGQAFNATPVALRSRQTTGGLYLSDTWDLTPRLSVTAGGRYNRVRISLQDRRGTALDGTSTYGRLNPALGLAFRVRPELSAYLGYSEGSRAPTPGEIECSDPTRPCLLPSSLSADPPVLKAVVSRTVEAGVRGQRPWAGGRLSFSAGLYRTEVSDDIYGVATSLSAGYFTNIKGTRRQGGDIDLTFRDDRLTAYASLAHVDATFATDLVLPSPSNPAQDAAGNIRVRRGARLPGIPANRLKAGFDLELGAGWRIGADLKASDSQVLRGDEANALPPLPGYGVAGLHASWQIRPQLALSGRLENVLARRYATFGVLGDPTGVPVRGLPAAGPADPRFLSPAAPRAAYVELKARF